jgi:hypothetical protein
MTRVDVERLLETYGLERILEDSETDLASMLLILNDLGFIYLEMYDDN